MKTRRGSGAMTESNEATLSKQSCRFEALLTSFSIYLVYFLWSNELMGFFCHACIIICWCSVWQTVFSCKLLILNFRGLKNSGSAFQRTHTPIRHNFMTTCLILGGSRSDILESTGPLKVCCGIWCQDVNNRSFKSCKLRLDRLFSTSHRCMIGLRSGEFWTANKLLKLVVVLHKPFLNHFALWQDALSCRKRPRPSGNTVSIKGAMLKQVGCVKVRFTWMTGPKVFQQNIAQSMPACLPIVHPGPRCSPGDWHTWSSTWSK